jgi:hypothetical protein
VAIVRVTMATIRSSTCLIADDVPAGVDGPSVAGSEM